MKNIGFYVVLAMLFLSCEKQQEDFLPEEGQAEFSFSINSDSPLDGKLKSASDIHAVIVTVENEEGVVHESKEIVLYHMDDAFVSEPLSLIEGVYTLTKFLVVEESNKILYAAPKKGSNYEYLVENPLDIEFVVTGNEVVRVEPQVLSVGESEPEDFGYVSFDFDLVRTFDFLISAFSYSHSLHDFEMTSANLEIRMSDSLLLQQNLMDSTNAIRVPDKNKDYLLVVTKDGYQRYEQAFSNEELKEYFHQPLVILLLRTDEDIVVLQPDAAEGKDAFVHSYNHAKNYGEHHLLQSLAWTIKGSPTVLRSYLDFDLSLIPAEKEIENVYLSLYAAHDSVTASKGHSQLTGSNASYIRRVTSEWNESSITWDEQPANTDLNQVVIPQDTSSTQDYVGINVTPLIRDILENPSAGHGLMVRLIDETSYRSLLFASSDHPDPQKRPKLVIKYK